MDEDGRHLVVIAALDNLGKGAAGSAVQSMNLMLDLDERVGLEFPGMYPVMNGREERQDLLVVKIGGGAGLDLDAVCADLVRVSTRQLVVVHGVSAIMDEMCRDRGIEVQTLTSPSGHSSRYTSPAIRDVYVEAANLANGQIVDACADWESRRMV